MAVTSPIGLFIVLTEALGDVRESFLSLCLPSRPQQRWSDSCPRRADLREAIKYDPGALLDHLPLLGS